MSAPETPRSSRTIFDFDALECAEHAADDSLWLLATMVSLWRRLPTILPSTAIASLAMLSTGPPFFAACADDVCSERLFGLNGWLEDANDSCDVSDEDPVRRNPVRCSLVSPALPTSALILASVTFVVVSTMDSADLPNRVPCVLQLLIVALAALQLYSTAIAAGLLLVQSLRAFQ